MGRLNKKAFPSPSLAFRYRETPRSGNDINGLGEQAPRRAVPLFHGSGARVLEWQRMETFFALINPWRVYWLNLVNRWMLRNADGVIAKRKVPVADEQAQSREIKEKALAFGAGKVGVTRLSESAMYEGVTPDYQYAVVILYPMNADEMQHITQPRAGLETMRAYNEIAAITVKLAKHIRSQGWRARAFCEAADILHIPLAIDAGLGQLGKHGSLICAEFGSSMRIATILTDLPLTTDEPVDLGVEDLCAGCRRCTIDCPVDAISDSKQLVRGVEKWYVDFDRCAPYFTATVGCGICIEVCPWTIPERGPLLSQQLLAKRSQKRANQATGL